MPRLTLRIASDTKIDVLAVMTVTSLSEVTTEVEDWDESVEEDEIGVPEFVFDSQLPSLRVYPEVHSVQADERQAIQYCTVH